MRRNYGIAVLALGCVGLSCLSGISAARGDEMIYGYDANVVPYDAVAGFVIADPCVPPCSESVSGGRFRLQWTQADDIANYHYWIAFPPALPPPTLWVEWRFKSNHPLGPNFTGCDGIFAVKFGATLEPTNMYGDAAISDSGPGFIEPLPFNEWHLYRYESLGGQNFRVWVNGKLLTDSGPNAGNNGAAYVQLAGRGGCLGDQFPNMINEWDFVRYGTIGSGEHIVSTDPPSGNLGPEGYTNFTTFRVTFDAPNYVYIDDIAVSVTGGSAPMVTATRRTDTNGPETVEIVLNGPLPQNQLTRFTLTDAAGTQNIDYDFRPPAPPIPATSTTGLIAGFVILLFAGGMIARNRLA